MVKNNKVEAALLKTSYGPQGRTLHSGQHQHTPRHLHREGRHLQHCTNPVVHAYGLGAAVPNAQQPAGPAGRGLGSAWRRCEQWRRAPPAALLPQWEEQLDTMTQWGC